MSDTIIQLSLAMALFIISHLAMSTKVCRTIVISRYGKYTFVGSYSIVSGLLLGWAVYSFLYAPNIPIFQSSATLQHISLSLMIFSTFLVVAGYTTPNPGIMGMERIGLNAGAKGVLKITRHPVMWGVVLWGISHILGNGHVAAIIFFGGFSVLALVGAVHIDQKRHADFGESWTRYQNDTSFWPMLAIITGKVRIGRGEIPWWQTVLSVLIYFIILWVHSELGRKFFSLNAI